MKCCRCRSDCGTRQLRPSPPQKDPRRCLTLLPCALSCAPWPRARNTAPPGQAIAHPCRDCAISRAPCDDLGCQHCLFRQFGQVPPSESGMFDLPSAHRSRSRSRSAWQVRQEEDTRHEHGLDQHVVGLDDSAVCRAWEAENPAATLVECSPVHQCEGRPTTTSWSAQRQCLPAHLPQFRKAH